MQAHTRARRYTTMRDVASLAGVSVKTVSRVLNGEPNVAAETVEKVERAATELSYQINLYAGALSRSGSQTRTVGLLLESVDNPFSGALYKGVEEVMRPAGIDILAASLSSVQGERAALTGFLRRRVDSMIVTTGVNDHRYLLREPFQGTPIVFVDRAPKLKTFDAVTSSNYDGAVVGARHLLERGHRRIAFVSGARSISTLEERYRGFAGELNAWGIDLPRDLLLEGSRDALEAEVAVHSLLNGTNPPTAIFAGQNLVTLGAIRALHKAGQQSRVALIGFDDMILFDLLRPAITVVAQDPLQLGLIAAQRVFARMRGEAVNPELIVVPTRLITRGSGEIPV